MVIIDEAMQQQKEGSEMIDRLITSHANLFRRLNAINNKVAQPPHTQRVLREARKLNEYFAETDFIIKQQKKEQNND